MTELSAGTRVIFTDSEDGTTEAGVVVSFYPVSAKFAAEEGHPGSAGEYAIKLDSGAGAVAWPHELTAEDEQARRTSTEWGWRRSPKGDVRIVPSAFSASDVYHKLQEDGRTWQGVKYQIVSREVTDWAWRESVSKTEGGK